MALIEQHTKPEVCEYVGWGTNSRGGYVTLRCPHCGRVRRQELRGERWHRAQFCDGRQIKFFEE